MTVTFDWKWTSIQAAGRPLRRVCAATVIAVGSLSVAVPAEAETLHQALAAAYKYNPQLDAERARLRSTDENVAIANSGFRPNIGATADITRDWQRTRPPSVGDGGNTSKGYSVNLTQPIFNGFQTINAVNEAEAFVRAGRETLRTTEQAVLLQAVTAYMDVIRDQAIVRLRENNVNVLSRELQATRDRFAVGEVTRTDVAQAEARRAASISALDLARSNLKISRATFERAPVPLPMATHYRRDRRDIPTATPATSGGTSDTWRTVRDRFSAPRSSSAEPFPSPRPRRKPRP